MLNFRHFFLDLRLVHYLFRTTIVLDKTLDTMTLTYKNLIRSSVIIYPLSDVTGIENIHRKGFIQVVVWLKLGNKYKGKAIELLRVGGSTAFSSLASQLTTLSAFSRTITEFLSEQSTFIFEDDWIIENHGDFIKIFRDYNDYTIRMELSIDRRKRLLIWISDQERGSCSLNEIEDLKLEDHPKDTDLSEDPSDRIVLITKDGETRPISPYYFKFSRGQHSPGLLKMLKKYIGEE